MVNHSDIGVDYERDGFAIAATSFDELALTALSKEADRLAQLPTDDRVLEHDGRTTRALHGCHQRSALMDALTRLPQTLGLAQTLLDGEVYVYQFKINMKAAFSGGAWAWHQDFIYWQREDGMPACRALNLVVFLDDVTERNGPLLVIPQSHRDGVIAPLSLDDSAGQRSWHDHVGEDLKYTLAPDWVARFEAVEPRRALTGPAGTVVVFHPNLAHASAPNTSPQGRRLLIITYNRTDNAPARSTRPIFLVSQVTTPLTACDRLPLSESGKAASRADT